MQSKNLNIDQLIERCKKADKSAQFELYKRYYKAMYNTAYRILNNSFEAEDIMQESFLIAYTKLGTFKAENKEGKNDATFGAWLKRIVINKSLTQVRKLNKYNFTPLERIEKERVQENEINNYSALKTQTVINEINNLKDSYSLVLNLHFIEGFDYREMADIMDISYENVRVLMSRAKHKLKQKINADYEHIS
ncbi:MAG: sigma-70 family RNA polymerase sigma factor [Flavobacteriaceae bacterium]